MSRIAVLGAAGYVGHALRAELDARGLEHVDVDQTSFDLLDFTRLLAFLRQAQPTFLVNAAGYTGRPNIEACETAKHATLAGNALLPLTLRAACEVTETPWAHVSTGCIFSGAKLVLAGRTEVHKNLLDATAQTLLAEGAEIRGFVETDTPNFTFDDPPVSFYSGSKALGELALAGAPQCYVVRLRIPFDQHDHPRNYLSKLLTFPMAIESYNSISHLGQFVGAILDLWQHRAPFGTYNLTNPGYVTTREVVDLLRKHVAPERDFQVGRLETKVPRANCVLDADKAVAAGARLEPIHQALERAMRAFERKR